MGLRHGLIPTTPRVLGPAALSVAMALPVSACRRRAPLDDSAPPPLYAVDRLAPGDQPIGTEKAFSLRLPRQSVVVSRFGDTVHVTSTLTAAELSAFVRLHVRGPDAGANTFDDVVVPDDAKRRLFITVKPASRADGSRSEMFVRDGTRPPEKAKLSEEERWRQAGVTPDGKLLDPTRME